jgi:hypothetical protein
MQMAISTTGRRLLCILCSVYVLSKMLKLCGAEGSSFRLWWMLSAFLFSEASVDDVSYLLLKHHLLSVFIRLIDCWDLSNNAECSEVRLVRW